MLRSRRIFRRDMRCGESDILLLFDIFGKVAQGLVELEEAHGPKSIVAYRFALPLLVRQRLYCFRCHGGAINAR